METESLALDLKDQISGPAREMKRSLQELRGEMVAAGNAQLTMQAKMAKAKPLAPAMATEQRQLAAAQKDASKSAKAEADALEALGGELVMVAGYALAAAAAFGALVFEGLKLAAEAYTFRKHMENVYTQFQGIAEAGQRTYEMVRVMSRTLPIPQEKAFESAQELLSLGLQGQNRLHNTVQAIAYMQGVMGDQAGSKLKSIISSTQGTTMGGRFRGTFSVTPQELKEIGLSYDQLTNVLAAKLGKSNAVTKQMLMYGRIDAATGIDALNDAVAKGGIGKSLKDALLAPDVLMRQFKEHVRDLFKDVDAKPLLQEIRNIVNLFDQGNATGRGMKDTITSVSKTVISFAKEALVQAQLAVLRFGTFVYRAALPLKPMVNEFKKLAHNKSFMEGLTIAVYAFGGAILVAAGALLMFGYIWASFFNLNEKLTERIPEWERTGVDLVAGLVRGVALGGKQFEDAMHDLGVGGLKQIKDVFEIHSPSRKMMDAGRQLTAGLRMGAAEGGLDIYGGGIAVTTKAGAAQGASGAPVSVTIAPGAIVISGGNAPMPDMHRMVEDAMADLVERIGEELGRGRDS